MNGLKFIHDCMQGLVATPKMSFHVNAKNCLSEDVHLEFISQKLHTCRSFHESHQSTYSEMKTIVSFKHLVYPSVKTLHLMNGKAHLSSTWTHSENRIFQQPCKDLSAGVNESWWRGGRCNLLMRIRMMRMR